PSDRRRSAQRIVGRGMGFFGWARSHIYVRSVTASRAPGNRRGRSRDQGRTAGWGADMDLSEFRAIGNLASMFYDQASRRGDAPFLWSKQNDVYRPLSWHSVSRRAARLAESLRQQGV